MRQPTLSKLVIAACVALLITNYAKAEDVWAQKITAAILMSQGDATSASDLGQIYPGGHDVKSVRNEHCLHGYDFQTSAGTADIKQFYATQASHNGLVSQGEKYDKDAEEELIDFGDTKAHSFLSITIFYDTPQRVGVIWGVNTFAPECR